MDLLNENQYVEPKQTKGKKIVMALIILSIIAVIAIIIIMSSIDTSTEIETTIFINGEQKEITPALMVNDTQGVQYISLKELSSLVEYEYYNSEYNNYEEDTKKCYIKNKNLIFGFEEGSNIIYKYEEGTNLDYQYYTLNSNVLTYNNKLYISVADLSKALNIYCTISENKQISISTMEYLSTAYQANLNDLGYIVTTEPNNQKALAYGWIIANKNGVWSVLNTELEEIISAKYSSIYFDELNLNYIVSNLDGQYGIITSTGNIKQKLEYDGLELLNYENGLYKVKFNNKYGVMNTDGKRIMEIEYDEIGYQAEPNNKILYTLIIPEIDEKSGPLVVVKQNGLYGLIAIETGEIILPCDHLEKIYLVNEIDGNQYKVYVQEQTMGLKEYMDLRAQQT